MNIADLVVDLVTHDTVSGDPRPQRNAIESVVSLLQSADRGIHVEHGLDHVHPWALITNDAPPSAARLLFACHVDTVAIGAVGDWEFDPYSGDIEGGVVRGRGTSDMKAGIAAAVDAVVDAVSRGVPTGLLLTSDEEIGSLGAAAAVAAVADVSVGAVIVPEATGNAVHLGHRGALWLDIVTRGVAAHGSTPDRGVNAVLRMLDVIDRAQRELPLAQDAFLGSETWNLGQMSGGSAPNIVPDRAHAVVDHRTVGDGRDLVQWWRSQAEVDDVTVTIDLPGVQTDADDPWVRTLPNAVANTPVTYFTDASFIASAAPNAPIVIWGPGTPALMHAANETVSVAEVNAAAQAYRATARAWPVVD